MPYLSRYTIVCFLLGAFALLGWSGEQPATKKGPAEPEEKAAKELLEKVQGTWELVSWEEGGKADARIKKTSTLTFTDNRWKMILVDADGDFVQSGRWDFHQLTKGNKRLNSVSTEGPNKGLKTFAIIKLEGNTLTVCENLVARNWPTAFASTGAGCGEQMILWKRRK